MPSGLCIASSCGLAGRLRAHRGCPIGLPSRATLFGMTALSCPAVSRSAPGGHLYRSLLQGETPSLCPKGEPALRAAGGCEQHGSCRQCRARNPRHPPRQARLRAHPSLICCLRDTSVWRHGVRLCRLLPAGLGRSTLLTKADKLREEQPTEAAIQCSKLRKGLVGRGSLSVGR